nr:MAG TPA: hypothetical protein [Caudoviricetes sp.]
MPNQLLSLVLPPIVIYFSTLSISKYILISISFAYLLSIFNKRLLTNIVITIYIENIILSYLNKKHPPKRG